MSTPPHQDAPPASPDAEVRPQAPASAWSLGWLLPLLAYAAWVRWPLLDFGFSPDEIANVVQATAWQIYDHPETGVNPPLYRWMFNLPFDAWEGARAGRLWSMFCSLLSVAMGFLIARRMSGGAAAAGLVAGVLLAAHPWVIRYAAMYRIYAFWSASLLLCLWSLARAMEAEHARPRWVWTATAVFLGCCLPWIHYFSVPVLLLIGLGIVVGMPGKRRWVAVFVPAAVGCLPLVPKVLFEGGRRVAPDREPMVDTMLRLASLDLYPPPWPWFPITGAIQRSTGWYPDQGVFMALCVLVTLAAVGLRWRRLTTLARLMWLASVGVLLGAATLGQLQYVRPSTLVMVAITAAPVLGSAPFLLVPSGWRRGLGVAFMAALWLGGLSYGRAYPDLWRGEEGGPWVVEHIQELVASAEGRAVHIHPKERIWTVWFHLAHKPPREAPRGAACGKARPCFEAWSTPFIGVDFPGDGAEVDGVLIHLDGYRPAELATACTVVEDSGVWGVWDCPGSG